MTLKELRKVLLGRYLHFTANYRSVDDVWGGIVKKVEKDRLYLIPYFNDMLIKEKDAIMAISRDEIEKLAEEKHLWDYDIIYTQLLDKAPQIGDIIIVTIGIPIAFGFKEEVMFYAIGGNKYEYAGNCAKCSFKFIYCSHWCKKYKCSYLESFYPNYNNNPWLKHLLNK